MLPEKNIIIRLYFQSQKLGSAKKYAKGEEIKLSSRLHFALQEDLPLQKTARNKTLDLLPEFEGES